MQAVFRTGLHPRQENAFNASLSSEVFFTSLRRKGESAEAPGLRRVALFGRNQSMSLATITAHCRPAMQQLRTDSADVVMLFIGKRDLHFSIEICRSPPLLQWIQEKGQSPKLPTDISHVGPQCMT